MSRKPATSATKKPAKKPAAKKVAKSKSDVVIETDEIIVTQVPAYLSPEVPTATPPVIDPKDVLITKMQEMMEKMMEQNQLLMQQIADGKVNQSQSDEKQRETIYKPLRSKVNYRMQYYDYDAEGNKILRNPMYEYRDFETMEELLAYADDNNM